jgi:hypothetical protein
MRCTRALVVVVSTVAIFHLDMRAALLISRYIDCKYLLMKPCLQNKFRVETYLICQRLGQNLGS